MTLNSDLSSWTMQMSSVEDSCGIPLKMGGEVQLFLRISMYKSLGLDVTMAMFPANDGEPALE